MFKCLLFIHKQLQRQRIFRLTYYSLFEWLLIKLFIYLKRSLLAECPQHQSCQHIIINLYKKLLKNHFQQLRQPQLSFKRSNSCFKSTRTIPETSLLPCDPPSCCLSPVDWLPGLHCWQEQLCLSVFPGGVRGQRGCLLWTSSTGGSERPAEPVLRRRRRIHLRLKWDLPPS